ncbi:MAG: hypothetical protein ACRD3Q_06470, partial [Terriglobales bacterium]
HLNEYMSDDNQPSSSESRRTEHERSHRPSRADGILRPVTCASVAEVSGGILVLMMITIKGGTLNSSYNPKKKAPQCGARAQLTHQMITPFSTSSSVPPSVSSSFQRFGAEHLSSCASVVGGHLCYDRFDQQGRRNLEPQ